MKTKIYLIFGALCLFLSTSVLVFAKDCTSVFLAVQKVAKAKNIKSFLNFVHPKGLDEFYTDGGYLSRPTRKEVFYLLQSKNNNDVKSFFDTLPNQKKDSMEIWDIKNEETGKMEKDCNIWAQDWTIGFLWENKKWYIRMFGSW